LVDSEAEHTPRGLDQPPTLPSCQPCNATALLQHRGVFWRILKWKFARGNNYQFRTTKGLGKPNSQSSIKIYVSLTQKRPWTSVRRVPRKINQTLTLYGGNPPWSCLVYLVKLGTMLIFTSSNLAFALAPHFDALDRHSPFVRRPPSRLPLLLVIPKLLRPRQTLVTPWLVRNTVFEEAICSTNRHVENQVEWLIEGRVEFSCLRPWVKERRMVQN